MWPLPPGHGVWVCTDCLTPIARIQEFITMRSMTVSDEVVQIGTFYDVYRRNVTLNPTEWTQTEEGYKVTRLSCHGCRTCVGLCLLYETDTTRTFFYEILLTRRTTIVLL